MYDMKTMHDMTARPQIFVDCDGVLADFDLAFESVFNVSSVAYEDRFGSNAFWEDIQNIQPPFFRNLPLMPNAVLLMNELRKYTPVILTGCPNGGWSELQKRDWADEHFGDVLIITCAARDKRNFMQRGDVLIDDRTKHQHLWEEAGGKFIHYTDAHVNDALAELEKYLEAKR